MQILFNGNVTGGTAAGDAATGTAAEGSLGPGAIFVNGTVTNSKGTLSHKPPSNSGVSRQLVLSSTLQWKLGPGG